MGPAPVLGLSGSPLKTWCLEEVMEVGLGPSSATALLLDHGKAMDAS